MTPSSFFLAILGLAAVAYSLGWKRALAVAKPAGGLNRLHSRPGYHATLTALWCALPALAIVALWLALEPVLVKALVLADLPEELRGLSSGRLNLVFNDIKNLLAGNFLGTAADPALEAAAAHYRQLKTISQAALAVLVLACALAGTVGVHRRIKPTLRARNQVETIFRAILLLCSSLAVFTTVGIVLSVLFEAIRFFQSVSPGEFFFGLKWSPQLAIRADQVGSSGAFGAIPVFLGTVLISAIAMSVAAPVGVLAAIYLSEYAGPRLRAVAKPLMEILAGIPTVVYGFFAALTVAPLIRSGGSLLGLEASSESALAAGLVMGIMIIPFVSSLSDDVLNAVPQSLRDGSYGLGATQSETIRRVLIPAALPGIIGGLLLGVSRAIGETMIVVMAAGLAANLTVNPLQAVTTVTVQIVTLLVGDQEFDSPKTLAAFALGLVLFVATLILNIIALYIVRNYREQYE